jgi:hypothetical protein
MARIECYIDDKTKEALSILARDKGLSISKYIAGVISNHIDNGNEAQRFQKKIHYMLAQILGSVYDKDIASRNVDEVKSIIRKIDEKLDSEI